MTSFASKFVRNESFALMKRTTMSAKKTNISKQFESFQTSFCTPFKSDAEIDENSAKISEEVFRESFEIMMKDNQKLSFEEGHQHSLGIIDEEKM